jgi:hypothetical protein
MVLKKEQKARINASTDFKTCTEQISAFVGLLGLIKLLELVKHNMQINGD